MDTPRIPSALADNPEIGAVISKLNMDGKNTNDSRRKYELGNLPDVSNDIKSRITNNEDIVQLFPDTELAIQILTSSILSPNDMLTPALNYNLESFRLPTDVKNVILDNVKKYVNKEYNVMGKLTTVLREALFTKGAYVEAIIPEASLDEVINPYSKDGQVSLEDSNIEYANKGYIFKKGKNSDFTMSLEELLPGDNKVTVNEDDIGVMITDNPSVLRIKNFKIDAVKLSMESSIYGKSKVKPEDDLELSNIFKDNRTYQAEYTVDVKDSQNTKRLSVDKPMIIKLPVESVIPIHVTNDVTKHIGYFVVLDENGLPITITDANMLDQGEVTSLMNSNDSKLNIINKAKMGLEGILKKDAIVEDLDSVYNEVVDNLIRTKLKNSDIGGLVDIKENADIYRVMFHRALKAKSTRLLFLPSELVQYYAFEYRDNGTGKSLLEKVSTLYSMRSILLFAKLMANLKNSITTTEITATLDDDDINPKQTMERVLSEVMKTRQTQLPIGVNKVEDLVEWSHKVGFKWNFKHKSLPDMQIDSTENSTNYTVPNDELSNDIEEYIIMSFGLTPDIIKSGYDPEFATSVVAKNLLLAKRVTQTQNLLNPMITLHIQKLLKADPKLQDIIKESITSNMADIIKYVNKDAKVAIKAKDDTVADFILNNIIADVNVTLPSPELHEAQSMKDAFDSYKTVVDEYIELVISSETLPGELVGDLSEHMDNLKTILKTVLIKKWMADNNYMTELNEFLTMEDGKPVFNVLDEYSTLVKNIQDIFLPFLKDMSKNKTKTNTNLGKIDNDDTTDDSMEPAGDDTEPEVTEEEVVEEDDGAGDDANIADEPDFNEDFDEK